ncbi:FtsX-like permease family protein [Kitasatospora xanthocidica]|uniref:FtsX-like permease family protein n=1 Tax=Kitasatospora xanthocidica TaxID=83382 RepID=UPI0036E63B02
MWQLSVRSVRHHAPLFLGTFVSLVLGVALIAISSAALGATFGVAQPTGDRPSVTLPDGEGNSHTVTGGAIDLGAVQTVLVMTGVICLFVTVFVISGTCALSIALRRRELGLLRLVGAGSRQVRRMVTGECLAVAVPAAAVGSLLAVLGTPLAVAALNHTGLSPVDLKDAPLAVPLLIAVPAGLLMAVLGAAAASRRAARVHATEALREAELDSRAMTGGRWTMGLLLLAVGGLMVWLARGADLEGATPLALFGTLFLTGAAALLGPLYLGPLIRLLGVPLRRSGSVPAQLAVASLAAARLRTAASVGPVLAIVAVVGVFTSVLGTTGATVKADDRGRTVGQLIVEAPGGGALDPAVLESLRRDPRVAAVSAPATTDIAVADRTSVRQDRGAAVDLPALARTHRLDVAEGTVRDLAPGELAVSREYAGWYGYHVGTELTYGLYGRKPATGTVVAIVDGGSTLAQVLLPAGTPGLPGPERATVLLAGDAAGTAGTVAQDLAHRLGADRASVSTAAHWYDGTDDEQGRLNNLVLLVLAGPASGYALISVASTLVMSYSRRGREIAGMRLIGVASRQVRRTALWETAITTGLAAGVAAVLVAVGLGAYRAALSADYHEVALDVPWGTLAALVLACLAVGGAVALAATGRLLRQGEISAITARE